MAAVGAKLAFERIGVLRIARVTEVSSVAVVLADARVEPAAVEHARAVVVLVARLIFALEQHPAPVGGCRLKLFELTCEEIVARVLAFVNERFHF